jgi:hypothetical protein
MLLGSDESAEHQIAGKRPGQAFRNNVGNKFIVISFEFSAISEMKGAVLRSKNRPFFTCSE